MKKNIFTPILAGVLTIALSLGGTIAVSATNLHSNEAANSYDTPAVEVGEGVTTETTYSNDTPVAEVDEDITTEAPHKCAIARATESYHRFGCDECENYTRVYHDNESMVINQKNEFFHTWECHDCGYGYTERHYSVSEGCIEICACGYKLGENHNFRTSHNTVGHYDVCIDCGYTANGADHTMVNYFHGFYHDVECEDCRYEAARHVGVKYTTIDAVSCEAICRECGVTEAIPHEWDGFECRHCDYTKQGFTLAVANEINRYDDGYSIALLVDNCEVWVDVPSIEGWDFDEGDFVQIFHQGNNIYDIAVIIDGDVVCDWNNFKSYIEEDLILYGTPDDYHFEDIVIDEVVYEEDGSVTINFESGRNKQVITTPYVVYDLRDGKTYDLYEGDAILCYSPFRDVTYIVVIW